MYPHRIRLRGPWECEPLPCGSDLSHRVTMPCRWADVGLAGPVRCRRRFGYPGTIDADERVWLTCSGLSDTAGVSLNGARLAERQVAPFEFDVTDLLRARNELVLDVEGSSENSGVWGEVALEVRCTAYLRSVRAGPVGDALEVSGEVVGVSDRPLELYVMLNRHQAAYEVIAPSPEGQPFRLMVARPAGADGPATVQVDLVNGATVWYTLTQATGNCADSLPAPRGETGA
jgi:hypothetical protein